MPVQFMRRLEIDMTEQTETSDLDRWLAALQEAILERERALFSAKVLEEGRKPQNMGVMLDDGFASCLGVHPCLVIPW